MARFNKKTAAEAGTKSSRAGLPNKATAELRENIKIIIEENLDQLRKDLIKMSPRDRVAALIALAKFVLPRLQAIDHTTAGNAMAREVIIRLSDINTEENE